MAEEALKETERISDEIAERLEAMRGALEQRLDRLSADVAQLNQAEPKPASSPEEELGQLLLKIIRAGKCQMHVHKQIAEFATEKTARGVRRAAETALEANEVRPLPEYAVKAFTRLAEDPLYAVNRKAESGRTEADASGT